MCKTTSPSGTLKNICDHGAYRDLCITCHPIDCEIVTEAIASTVQVARVDLLNRYDAKRDLLDDATERGDRDEMSRLRRELHGMAVAAR